MHSKYIRLFLLGIFLISIITVAAQEKVGYINFEELIASMPESKIADSTLASYQHALIQNYQEMQFNFQKQNNLLNSKDSSKYTRSQLEIKKQDLQNLYLKLENYQTVATGQLNDKRKLLYDPIEKKAQGAVVEVAKENGYGYVFRENMVSDEFGPRQFVIYSSGVSLLSLTQSKLGIK